MEQDYDRDSNIKMKTEKLQECFYLGISELHKSQPEWNKT